MKPYLKEILNNLIKSDTWKIQLTIEITFISSKDTDEECIVYSKCDNVRIMIKVKQIKLSKNFLNHFFLEIKLGWKHQ